MEKIPKKFQIFPAPNYKARKKQKLALTKKIFVVGNGGWGREYAMEIFLV